jgi:ABC-type taurine transport system ATPase subunit
LPLIDIRNLSVSYETVSGVSVDALRDIDLSIYPGDFFCVVGPSGCGKSTLLAAIAGFINPGQGTLTDQGRPVTGPDPRRGMVFQQPELFPWLTVYKNVEFGPRMRGVSSSERRDITENCLRSVRLWDFRNAYPYELSGGMQQRAAIARVLANNPRILLMDEPFGALDALTREHLQEELLSLWGRTGKTVIFVTHSVEEAVYLGTDIIVFSDRPGRIIARFKPGFSKNGGSSRKVKALPEFVSLREDVLSRIWSIS